MATVPNAAPELMQTMTILLKVRIAETTEAVIKTAVEDFEARLRRQIATAAMEVENFYELSRQANRLVITVKMPETK